MSDNAEIVDDAEAPAENKEEAQEQPTVQATEEEEVNYCLIKKRFVRHALCSELNMLTMMGRGSENS